MKGCFKMSAAVCVFVTLAALPLQAQQVTLTWTAGGAGGGWYSIAGGIAAIVKEADADIVIKGPRSAGDCPS
mgnify:CR=1 FL=1